MCILQTLTIFMDYIFINMYIDFHCQNWRLISIPIIIVKRSELEFFKLHFVNIYKMFSSRWKINHQLFSNFSASNQFVFLNNFPPHIYLVYAEDLKLNVFKATSSSMTLYWRKCNLCFRILRTFVLFMTMLLYHQLNNYRIYSFI